MPEVQERELGQTEKTRKDFVVATKPRKAKPMETEVEAYDFIRQDLRDLRWSVRNPSLGTGGQVWTQNQCLSHAEIKQALGAMRPENIVKISEKFLWVIEAKSTRKDLTKAIDEAVDDYAEKINNARGNFRAILASGVAGNEAAGYLIKTKIRLDGRWLPVTINGQEATGLLSPESVKFLIERNTSDIHDYAPPQYLFLQAAEHINEYLHIGGINKNDRAKTMAALLLSVLDEPPNLDTALPVLIGEINARSKAKLIENGKSDFFPFVKIIAPTSATNHVKYKSALILTIQELLKLNIRSAMNSRTDVLGQFYEVFLKYGNGAKEIGIVLTPRHITRFAVEAIGISYKDVVLDVACGTGGFLVAAFDHVRRTATPSQVERFKELGLFGIEQESAVALLAIVNMIFRGDGKHNITEGNCFTTYLKSHTSDNHPSAKLCNLPPQVGQEGVTRVLMNPPFALRGSTDQEYRFVSAALSLMVDGGILFSLLPMDSMFGARDERVWRSEELLRNHTLMGVVSFPDELFYPAAQKQVVGIIVKKGFPHPHQQPVFWGRINRDGHLKVKSKRLAATDLIPPRQEKDELSEILPILRAFVNASGSSSINIPTLCKTAPIDFDDPLLELVPEAYLDSITPNENQVSERLDRQIRDIISGLVTIDLRYDNGIPTILEAARRGKQIKQTSVAPKDPKQFKDFTLDSIFSLTAGHYHSLADERSGQVPVASCADTDNGIIGGYSIPADRIHENAMTIAYNGSPLTTKLHPYRFAAKDDVAVAVPLQNYPIEALIFIVATLNAERWRFSYYRKCFQSKLGKLLIKLPITTSGEIDTEWMLATVRTQPYWWFLAPRLDQWHILRLSN